MGTRIAMRRHRGCLQTQYRRSSPPCAEGLVSPDAMAGGCRVLKRYPSNGLVARRQRTAKPFGAFERSHITVPFGIR